MIDSVSDEGASQADLKRTRRIRRENMATPTIDRLPPHSPECEMGVLGCILMSPRECGNEAIVFFGTAITEIMYDLRHQTILDAIVEMLSNLEAVDVITLQQKLKDKGLLEQVGGIMFLATLPDAVPSAANFIYYAEFLREKYVLRKTLQTCTDVVRTIYESEEDVDSVMDQVERDILGIRNFARTQKEPTMKDSVKEAIEVIEQYHARQGALLGIGTGFTDFDKMTGGLCPGDMIVIAARPSIGKTSLALNVAEHVAIDQKLPVGIFSLEMKRAALVMRMICSRSRTNIRNVTDGFLAERDFPKITGAAGKLSNAPIYIDDAGSLTIMQLRSKARRMVQQYGIKVLVIDYLQKLTAWIGKKRIENRQQEVTEISNGIKALAMELDIPVVVLCQLNRGLEKDKGRKPMMSDLRESGAIEQDADTIGLLYKPATDDDEEKVGEYLEAVPVNLIIAKQRNGPTGEVNLTFLKSYTRFENASRVSDDDVPGDGTGRQQTF